MMQHAAAPASNPSTPLISVVMTVYNGQAYLQEAIESVQAQTYPRWELLVVDDGSSDDSAAIASSLASGDSRIRLICLPHGGRSRASNAGIAEAQGEWIARLDQDDVALPERLEVQAAWMDENGLDVCGSLVRIFGQEEGVWWFPETPAAVRTELFFRCAVLQSMVMLRGDVARQHPYCETVMMDDYELWTRLAPNHAIGNVPRVLGRYRTHPAQSTWREGKIFNADQASLRKRYFARLYPEASQRECEILASLAEGKPMESISDLRAAGEWLSRMAKIEDPLLRHRLQARWMAACFRSTHLGPTAGCCYRELSLSTEPLSAASHLRLSIACALRARHGSKLHSAISRVAAVWDNFRTGSL